MVATILSIVAYLLPLIIQGVQSFIYNAPKRAAEARNAEIEKGRQAVTARDTGIVELRLSRLLPLQAGPSPSSGANAGVNSNPLGEGRAGTIRRLAALGLRTVAADGDGGESAKALK